MQGKLSDDEAERVETDSESCDDTTAESGSWGQDDSDSACPPEEAETLLPTDTEGLRQETRRLLSNAAEGGSLESVLANLGKRPLSIAMKDQPVQEIKLEVQEIKLEDVRQKVKAALFQSLANGRLTTILNEAVQVSSPEPAESLETLRESLKQALSNAARAGNLSAAMKEAKLEGARRKARQALSEAARDGRLENQFLTIKQTREAASPGLELFRGQVRDVLSKAIGNGQFHKVLDDVQRDRDRQDARKATRKVLTQAMVDGRLDMALQSVARSAAPKPPAVAAPPQNVLVKDLRARLKQVLSHSAMDGSLGESLEQANKKKEKATEAAVTLGAIDKARLDLSRAALDGRLGAALAQVKAMKEAPQEASIEELRQQVRKAIHRALVDGSLDKIVSDTKKDNDEAALEMLRNQAKEALSRAVSNGQLTASFELAKKLKQESVITNARQLLTTAALNGSLWLALQEVKHIHAPAAGADREESEVRRLAKEALIKGSHDGRLSQYLREVNHNHAPAARANQGEPDVRRMAKDALIKGSQDGRLWQFLREAQSRRPAPEEGRDTEEVDLGEMRSALKAMLTRTARDGKLSEALTEVQQAAKPQSNEAPEEEARVCRKSRRMLCNRGLEKALPAEFKQAAHALRYDGEELPAPESEPSAPRLSVPTPVPSKEQRQSSPVPRQRTGGISKETLSIRIPTSTPASRQRRRIIGAVERAKGKQGCVDLTEDGEDEDAPARESSLARGYDALGANFHCIADKEDFVVAVKPSTPMGRCPPSPSGMSSRHAARHRVHLALSSAMAQDLGEDMATRSRPPTGREQAGVSAAASAMALDLGLGNSSGMRWGTSSRAATPTNRFRTSHSTGMIKTAKNQGSEGIAWVLPEVQAFSNKAAPALPALKGQRRSTGHDVMWSQSLNWTAPRWGGNQAIF